MGFVHRWQTQKLLQYFNCLNGNLLMSTTCLPYLVPNAEYPQVWQKQLHPSVPVTGNTSRCSTSQSGIGFCSPSWDPRTPQESVLYLALTDWRVGKPPGTHSEHWNQEKKPMRNRYKALKTCFPEDLPQTAENDWDELKLWYFCHWKGTKYLKPLYNFCCSGLCLK